MKRLIICDTNFQIFVALQLKLTLFSSDSVDIWISDHSRHMEQVSERLQKKNIFQQVRFIKTKERAYEKNKLKLILDVWKANFINNRNHEIDLYDEILFYGLDFKIYEIFDYYNRIGHKANWSRFEEGLFSYETDFAYGKRIVITRKIRKYLHMEDVANEINRYYCFLPELKEANKEWDFVKIPIDKLYNQKFISIFNDIYNYKPKAINQKYIFFASASDIEGNSFGETELVLKLAKELGENNLLVKMHPRDTRKIYEKHGIEVMRESFIPWEVIQLNLNMSDKILLTVNSGAFISISALYGNDINAKFLLREVETKNQVLVARTFNIERTLIRLHELGLCQNIIVR